MKFKVKSELHVNYRSKIAHAPLTPNGCWMYRPLNDPRRHCANYTTKELYLVWKNNYLGIAGFHNVVIRSGLYSLEELPSENTHTRH